MNDQPFGLDFGTTNSLAALVVGSEVRSLTNEADDKPHPSVIWYRGGEVIAGREARRHIESLEGGIIQGFVRSPKMALRREGPLHIEGRTLEPVDVVSEVLNHIQRTAADRIDVSYQISQAVLTIPVDFAGPQRRMLRSAARKAGIRVLQFVHEPVAALYAYLRAKSDYRRDLAQLENRIVLVFDWGGGTLDLTVCRVLGGVVMQVASRGNNEIGGDRFDERLRNEIRDRHAAQHDIANISAMEQPGVMASLLTQCELAKIALSDQETTTAILKDYLRSDGRARDLGVSLTRKDLEILSRDLVHRGLAEIDGLLEETGLSRSDIELCIATGGMVNMPAIWNGLVERFGSRVPMLPNRDRIIAEGAAWIARDGLRLKLAKPIELIVADGRPSRGAYLTLVDAGLELPIEGESTAVTSKRFHCVDPRDGVAVFEFAKPRKVGPLLSPDDERTTLHSMNLPVDPTARPFLERLECKVQIDHDYIARVSLSSKMRMEAVEAEFHDLDFGLALPADGVPGTVQENQNHRKDFAPGNQTNTSDGTSGANISLRSNVSMDDEKSHDEKWGLVPGDIVESWQPNYFGRRFNRGSKFQRNEKMYYEKCGHCHRTRYEIDRQGVTELCRISGCGIASSRAF